MRILLLTQWCDPEPTIKGLAFARELIHRGHDVEILTGFPNYPDGKMYPGYRLRAWQREKFDGVSVIRVFLYPSHSRSRIGRIANYGSFALSATGAGAFLTRRPDVVYAFQPPPTIGLPSIAIRALRGAPFVLDVQDLWPDTLAATGMLGRGLLLSAVGGLSRALYRSADRIVAQSPGMLSRLVEDGVDSRRGDVIYNWCADDGVTSRGPEVAPLGDRRPVSGMNVVFAGTMGLAQGLDTILDCAALCAEMVPAAQFVLVGGGVDRDRLQRRAAALRLQNVHFVSQVPMKDVGSILARADVLLVHLKDDPLFRITIPSKTQAYMAAGRPLLMAVRGDAADLVSRAGCGLLCEPENPQSMADRIAAFWRMGQESRVAMGEAGRRFYDQELSLRVGVAKFEAAFRAALSPDWH